MSSFDVRREAVGGRSYDGWVYRMGLWKYYLGANTETAAEQLACGEQWAKAEAMQAAANVRQAIREQHGELPSAERLIIQLARQRLTNALTDATEYSSDRTIYEQSIRDVLGFAPYCAFEPEEEMNLYQGMLIRIPPPEQASGHSHEHEHAELAPAPTQE